MRVLVKKWISHSVLWPRWSSAPVGSPFAFSGIANLGFVLKSMRRLRKFCFLGKKAGCFGAFSATGRCVALPQHMDEAEGAQWSYNTQTSVESNFSSYSTLAHLMRAWCDDTMWFVWGGLWRPSAHHSSSTHKWEDTAKGLWASVHLRVALFWWFISPKPMITTVFHTMSKGRSKWGFLKSNKLEKNEGK